MRDEMKQVREGLARVYQAPYLQTRETPSARPVVDELSIRKDDIIVEFGAGEGHFTLPIARRLEELRGLGVIFACDFSKVLVERLEGEVIAQGLGHHVRAVCLDEVEPQQLPFSDERVDSVLAVNALQYFANPMPYLGEIARVIVPFGNLLIADWREPSEEDHSRASTPEDLYPVLEAAGLEAVFRLDLEGYSWVIRATKPIIVSI